MPQSRGMTTTVHHRAQAGRPLTERHPALMSLVFLVCLVVVGGLAGLAVGRVLVVGAHLLLGVVGQGA